MKENAAETSKHVSPKGALNLPPLLDARRLEYGIVDEAFTKCQAVFDRIFVWQVDLHTEDTFMPGGLVKRPQVSMDASKKSAPRGILVSAGLMALDTLRSHGIDLGHIISFMSIQPWKLPLGFVDGIEEKLLMMRDGDVCGSEDLATAMRSWTVGITVHEGADGKRSHRYTDAAGRWWNPVLPWISDEQ